MTLFIISQNIKNDFLFEVYNKCILFILSILLTFKLIK